MVPQIRDRGDRPVCLALATLDPHHVEQTSRAFPAFTFPEQLLLSSFGRAPSPSDRRFGVGPFWDSLWLCLPLCCRPSLGSARQAPHARRWRKEGGLDPFSFRVLHFSVFHFPAIPLANGLSCRGFPRETPTNHKPLVGCFPPADCYSESPLRGRSDF